MNFLLSVVFCFALVIAPAAANAGRGTWYNTGLGSCGYYNNDGEPVVAVSHTLYDTFPGATGNPNHNPVCGQQVQITCNGKTVIARIVDRCESCTYGDLDLSPSTFQQCAPLSDGVISIQWNIIGAKSRRYMPRPQMDAE